MCLLIVKPAGKSIPLKYIDNAAISHPHGMGFAYPDGEKTIIVKNHKIDVDSLIVGLDEIEDRPAIVHFRYATHGSVSLDNTHPFALPMGYAAAHNGIFRNVTPIGDESDTRAFLRSHVAPRIESLSKIKPELEQLARGNRLAILSPQGETMILGEALGERRGGIWYSNDSAFSWDIPDKYDYDFTRSDEIAGEYPVGFCVSCGEDVPGDYVCDRCYEYYNDRYSLSADSILKLAEYGELPGMR